MLRMIATRDLIVKSTHLNSMTRAEESTSTDGGSCTFSHATYHASTGIIGDFTVHSQGILQGSVTLHYSDRLFTSSYTIC